ncbi:MAG: hypothetical protein JSU03_01585 [Bacteroidetes bacterium]|nr:hypothetical protein [Bacteroidota bacterium]MBS1755947.1 hypothetical protein [Bacteroidota bacterium]
MENSEFSYEDSIRLIDSMIKKAKKSYVTKGTASIVWGVLIVICSLVTWAQLQFSIHLDFNIWLLVFVALFVQIFFSIKEKKQRKFQSLDEDSISFVWTAFGIAIFLMSFYNSKYGSNESSTLFMILYGIPTFITGGIVKFKPLIIGGILCWVFSIISVFTEAKIDMLLMAASGLFAWLIPGIILWRKYQNRKMEKDGI